MLRQGDSQVFKKYSQMKLQMKREALEKLNRQANEMKAEVCQNTPVNLGCGTVLTQKRSKEEVEYLETAENALKSEQLQLCARSSAG